MPVSLGEKGDFMSKNICPCCDGKSEYLDISDRHSSFICVGCEIKIYHQLHDIMDREKLNKEKAYQYLIDNHLLSKNGGNI